MQIREEVELEPKKKKLYIAEDGTEFESASKCQLYESNQAIKKAFNVFDLKSAHYNGNYYFKFRYHKGQDDLFKNMIDLCITAYIDCKNKKIDNFRDIDNVQEFRTDKRPYDIFFEEQVWENNNIYLITVYHQEWCDSWDDFYVKLLDRNKAKTEILKQIGDFEHVFEIKWDNAICKVKEY